MAAAMFRGRSLRGRRLRDRHESGSENVALDSSKEPAENIKEVLIHIAGQHGVSRAKKLGYLNALVRLCCKFTADTNLGYTKEELLCCLRVGLFHEAKEVRAACLRALRYLCVDAATVRGMLLLHIDYLIVRSLDIVLDNEIERIHALRLIRKIMSVCPEKFPSSLLNVMVSIANNGSMERDRMVRSCLATICELALKNPVKVVKCGGLNCILRSVLDCHDLPRINESLVSTLLHLLNHPKTRQFIKINVDLEQLLAPFTDCHFRYSAESSEHSQGDDRENRFSASKMAIVTIIRSWPGMIRLCRPDGTGLQSLLGVLYLPNKETRKEIVDILYDLFRIPTPDWTDDFEQALLSTDPSQMRDQWRLSDGFVAEEGKAILPHLARTRPNLVENHLALILSALISAGVLEALVEVITTEDDFMAVRAAILLGELLHMANQIIPHESSQHSHCLPTLIALAASFELSKEQRNRASIAVTCLDRLHSLKKRGPIPCSLYLDQLMHYTNMGKNEKERPLKLNRDKLAVYVQKESDEVISQAVKDSFVLHTKEYARWDWDVIDAILKVRRDIFKRKLKSVFCDITGPVKMLSDPEMRKLEDQAYLRFVRRLIYFYKPSSQLFSMMELNQPISRQYTLVGCHLIDFLLDCDESESQKLLNDWLQDIGQCLSQICVTRTPPDVLFSSGNIVRLHTQDYFLFIGRFSTSSRGEKLLAKTGVFQYLLTLMTTTSHDTFIKLAVSSLDYARDNMARIILSKALTATSENARLYSTSLMRVLLRARVPFMSSWGMELLVMQLYDQSRVVAMEALSVISEACEEEVNLLTLIKMRPSVLHLGYKGAMLLARFTSVPQGFKFLSDANYLNNELKKWHEGFNEKYVHILEERLNEAMTTYEKTYDGSYTRRSAKRQLRQEVYVPIHLYGQLVQHKAGYQLLEKQEYLSEYYHVIRSHPLQTEEDIVKVKAALWAVGHISTSVWGLSMLEDENILPEIIKLAEECGVFSVRGTAFYVLGLVASTSKGAKQLSQFGWEAVRHRHQEAWSVVEDTETAYVEDTQTDHYLSISSLSVGSGKSDPEQRPAFHHLQAAYSTDESLSPSPKFRPKFFIDYLDRRSRSTSDASQKNLPILESPCEEYEASLLDTGQKTGLAELALTLHPQSSSVESNSHKSNSKSSSPIKTSNHTSPVKDQGALCVRQRLGSLDVVHQRSKSDTQKELDRRMEVTNVVHFRDADTGTVIFGSETIPRNNHRNRDNLPFLHRRSNSNCEVRTSRFDNVPFRLRSTSFRDERSSSNASSRTSKSRSDTDTTTSGIGSCDSGPTTTMEYSTLSPIPSASSITTDILGSSRSTSVGSERELVHPSDTLRKLVNLKRVPSLKRRFSNPALGHLSPIKTLDGKVAVNENSIIYTTTRDAQGYAVLRDLQRQRTVSVESEGDYGLANLFEDSAGSASKTQSLDFRDKRTARAASSVPWNLSFTSIQDLEQLQKKSYSGADLTRSSSAYRLSLHKASSGIRPQYVGISLPVDVNMIFQVSEGEDKRCSFDSTEDKTPEFCDFGYLKKRSVSQIIEDNGLENHTTENCLCCYKVRRPTEAGVHIQIMGADIDDSAFATGMDTDQSELSSSREVLNPALHIKSVKSRNSSFSEMAGSVNSGTSLESSAKGFSDESESGRALIRKEIVRLIVNISSSVGVKSAESSLLLLRQKFPTAFQDLCLYSEVSHILSHYHFRLAARRFIQELFQDLTFAELAEEPRLILGIVEDIDDGNKSREQTVKFTKDEEMQTLAESFS